MIKLGEGTKEGQVFLYGGDTVALQYMLTMIWNGRTLPEIRLLRDDKNFEDAISNALQQISNDVRNGVDKGAYVLQGLNTMPVEVDITKADIKRIDKYNFEVRKRKG